VKEIDAATLAVELGRIVVDVNDTQLRVKLRERARLLLASGHVDPAEEDLQECEQTFRSRSYEQVLMEAQIAHIRSDRATARRLAQQALADAERYGMPAGEMRVRRVMADAAETIDERIAHLLAARSVGLRAAATESLIRVEAELFDARLMRSEPSAPEVKLSSFQSRRSKPPISSRRRATGRSSPAMTAGVRRRLLDWPSSRCRRSPLRTPGPP
jgi:hypothetical protein